MTSQPVAYSSSSSSNIFKDTPGFGLAGAALGALQVWSTSCRTWRSSSLALADCRAGRRIQSRVNNSKRRLSDLHEKEEPRAVNTTTSEAGQLGSYTASAGYPHTSGERLTALLLAVASPAQMAVSTQKRGRRSLFEECQERLAYNSGASDQSESGLNRFACFLLLLLLL